MYADDVFCCHLSGIVVVEVAMDMIVFVQYRLHLLDVVHGVEYDIIGGVMDADSIRKEIKKLTQQMHRAAEDLEFELAAEIRDQIHKLEDDLLLVE